MQHINKYELLFADDTSLFLSNKKLTTLIEKVNNEIVKIALWFNTNKHSLNITTLFTPANKKPNVPTCAIQTNGSAIIQVNFTKFLGVYVDEHLNWSIHLNMLAAKLARNVGILGKLRHFLPSYILRTLYCSLILPHLQYCTLIWANTYFSKLNKVRVLKKESNMNN